MAQILFNPGVTWETLPKATVSHMIDQAYLLDQLAIMRDEWRDAVGSEDLSSVTVDLDLLFADFERLVTGE